VYINYVLLGMGLFMKKTDIKKYFGILFLFLFIQITKASNDTLRIRKFVDSVSKLANGEFVKVNEDLFLSNIAILKKYPKGELLYKQYGFLATKYVRNGNTTKARLYLDTCYDFAKSLTNKQFLAETKFTEGIYLKYNGNSSLALQNWFEAMDVFKQFKKEKKQYGCLAAIAREYLDLKQYDKAEMYAKEVIAGQEKLNDMPAVSSTYNLLANIYKGQKRYQEALVIFEKAKTIQQQRHDTLGLAYTHNNTANIYYKLKNLDKAEENWLISFDLFKHTADGFGTAMITNNIALCNIDRKRYQKGIEYAKQAVAYSTEYGIKVELQRAHSNLLDAYFGLNDFKSGYKEHEIIIELKDTEFNKDVASAVTEAEQKYKSKIQTDSITILNADKKVNTLLLEDKKNEATNYRNGLFIAILSLALLGGLGFFFFNRYKLKQRLTTANLLNEQQSQSIKAVIEAQELERKRIGSELHDSVGQKLGALKMHLQASEITPIVNELLLDTINETRSISHQLMPITLSNFGLSSALRELLQTSLPAAGIEYDYFNKTEEQRFSQEIETSIYRVCQEIIANVLKHSQAKLFNLQMYIQNKHLMIVAEDDGVGITSSTFDMGMGLLNMKARIHQLNGQIRFDLANENKGLLTTIKIPV
jgi:two-component system, NarL family, sensor kinase